MSVEIRKCTIADLEAEQNFSGLLAEYAAESRIDGFPPPSAKIEMYRVLNQSGALCIWGAFLDKGLIGFIAVISSVLPHYSVRVAVSESFFVSKEDRKTGAGLKLLHAAENHAEDIKSPGLLISAPIGSNLAEVLPRAGYVETTRAFFRKTKNA